jgi:hypothetical protein
MNLIALVLLAGGLDGPAAARLTLPYVNRGACPFECCTYREWSVEKDADVLTTHRDGAPVAFRVLKGERVRGVTGLVEVTRPGRAVLHGTRVLATNDGDVTVRPGEKILVLHPMGEGFWKVWVGGRVREAELHDKDETCFDRPPRHREPAPCAVRITTYPDWVWWAQVESGGRTGWTRQLDRFGDMDACG